jgi:plasmid stability protein
MSVVTVRNLDMSVKRALRERAAGRGVSMEQEIRDVLTRDVRNDPRQRPKASLEEIMKLSRKPDRPFDLKQAQDEVWDYLYESDKPR